MGHQIIQLVDFWHCVTDTFLSILRTCLSDQQFSSQPLNVLPFYISLPSHVPSLSTSLLLGGLANHSPAGFQCLL